MGLRSPWVWVVLIVLVIVLFGASKLPDITRNVGKSMKIFKNEVRDLREDTDMSSGPTVNPGNSSATPPEHHSTQPPSGSTPPAPPPAQDPPAAPHPGTPPADNSR